MSKTLSSASSEIRPIPLGPPPSATLSTPPRKDRSASFGSETAPKKGTLYIPREHKARHSRTLAKDTFKDVQHSIVAPLLGRFQQERKLPCVYINLLLPSSNAIFAFITDNKLDAVDVHRVHLSWIISALAPTPENTKKTKNLFTPRFLTLSPDRSLPIFEDKDDFSLTDSYGILKHLHKKYAVSESLYPEDSKKRAAVDEAVEGWKLEKLVMELIKIVVFEKIATKSAQRQQHPVSSLTKDITKYLGRMDTQLKNQHYVASDNLTIADYVCFGDVFVLKRINFDFSKMSYLRKWIDRMEKLESFKALDYEWTEQAKEFFPLGVSL